MAQRVTFWTGDTVEFPDGISARDVEDRRRVIVGHLLATGRLPERLRGSSALSSGTRPQGPEERALIDNELVRIVRPTGFEILKQYRTPRQAPRPRE
jgi:hypothetical protein